MFLYYIAIDPPLIIHLKLTRMVLIFLDGIKARTLFLRILAHFYGTCRLMRIFKFVTVKMTINLRPVSSTRIISIE